MRQFDARKFRAVKVLDKGEVRYIQHMGTDRTIAEAAWVSTGNSQDRSDNDVSRVLRYMATNNHWTPFGHALVTLRMKMPVFVARQWMRSNVGVVYNEESRRYRDHPPEFYVPTKWRSRAEKVKQGSGAELEYGQSEWCDPVYSTVVQRAILGYQELLSRGVAPEMARMLLPGSMYTEFWATASVAAWARMVNLRKHGHAQEEIQHYAHAVSFFLDKLYPVAWPWLMD